MKANKTTRIPTSSSMGIESEDSYTPMTKEAMVEGIKKRKVELGEMAKNLFSSEQKDD
jgi:mevalonate pyrophosphate decarboxylase